MHLLQHLVVVKKHLKYAKKYLVDVDCVRLLPFALALFLVALGDSLSGLAGLGGSFSRSLRRHR